MSDSLKNNLFLSGRFSYFKDKSHSVGPEFSYRSRTWDDIGYNGSDLEKFLFHLTCKQWMFIVHRKVVIIECFCVI